MKLFDILSLIARITFTGTLPVNISISQLVSFRSFSNGAEETMRQKGLNSNAVSDLFPPATFVFLHRILLVLHRKESAAIEKTHPTGRLDRSRH